MNDPRRHPLLDNLVFALALLLALTLAYYGLRRLALRPVSAPPASVSSPAAEEGALPSAGSGAGEVERAVGSLPPMRFSGAGSSRRRPVEVPAPGAAE